MGNNGQRGFVCLTINQQILSVHNRIVSYVVTLPYTILKKKSQRYRSITGLYRISPASGINFMFFSNRKFPIIHSLNRPSPLRPVPGRDTPGEDVLSARHHPHLDEGQKV